MQYEISSIALQDISQEQRRIIPVRIDETSVPTYLSDRQYIDLFQNVELGLQQLSDALKRTSPLGVTSPKRPQTTTRETRQTHIQNLREALLRGRLTLVCGAGVSVGAGIPTWSALLVRLLGSMMQRISNDHSLNLESDDVREFQNRYGSSALILGKYLKNNLGRDFSKEVRDALYASNPLSCPLIDAIIALARPQRDGRPLDSIVTFNFDCLIEDNLEKSSIPNKAIFSEAINHDSNELPIYHVHGFLPRTGSITDDLDLVFSEDAYHSQFIDPFSWSNLILLNKLTQNTCFFVGVSMTDPNMRRLLDVAWRKNPDKKMGHYIAKRLPTPSDRDNLDRVSRLLEEQDANALGLNVVWMDEFDELPSILKEIPVRNGK